MSGFVAALWAESLKARRSRVLPLTALGFALAPLMDGLFMVILKDPERARAMGLVSAKAQMIAGTADWPTFLGVLAQAAAVGGLLLFSLIVSWVFGREHADRTAKELLALPTPRAAIVAAKFTVVLLWCGAITLLALVVGFGVGAAVGLPGGSAELLWRGAFEVGAAAGLTIALMPPVALLASAGRGYLLPLGWAILTLFLAQILAATGWGSWFPWSVPALFSGLAGPRSAQLGAHSHVLVALVSLGGLAATFAWWLRADQPR